MTAASRALVGATLSALEVEQELFTAFTADGFGRFPWLERLGSCRSVSSRRTRKVGTPASLAVRKNRQPGSRWKEETGSQVVQLRALALSDHWRDGITMVLSKLRVPVRAAA